MIFNTKIPIQREQAIERFEYLVKNEKRIAIIDKKPKRTMKQNRYLHLLLGMFGLHFGYTLEEVKQDIFKKVVNPDTFYEGDKEYYGTKVDKWRSTADLDKGELTICIERFRNFSNDLGFYLASPEEHAQLQHYENELSKHESKIYI
ncbi:hypothetical protein C7S20_19330 [Christiangramia fulva]|uniref:Uncharacterized protein n=1 Tax=Christiangramia fulva TaxID=2126553 RepID=A0A2R3ZAE0_9FLAO|nr:hypothetical protein [Christiangramia fulva]AVR47231.1 hypothetical protein C7S20_19330 [Christiangramia fulva]